MAPRARPPACARRSGRIPRTAGTVQWLPRSLGSPPHMPGARTRPAPPLIWPPLRSTAPAHIARPPRPGRSAGPLSPAPVPARPSARAANRLLRRQPDLRLLSQGRDHVAGVGGQALGRLVQELETQGEPFVIECGAGLLNKLVAEAPAALFLLGLRARAPEGLLGLRMLRHLRDDRLELRDGTRKLPGLERLGASLERRRQRRGPRDFACPFDPPARSARPAASWPAAASSSAAPPQLPVFSDSLRQGACSARRSSRWRRTRRGPRASSASSLHLLELSRIGRVGDRSRGPSASRARRSGHAPAHGERLASGGGPGSGCSRAAGVLAGNGGRRSSSEKTARSRRFRPVSVDLTVRAMCGAALMSPVRWAAVAVAIARPESRFHPPRADQERGGLMSRARCVWWRRTARRNLRHVDRCLEGSPPLRDSAGGPHLSSSITENRPSSARSCTVTMFGMARRAHACASRKNGCGARRWPPSLSELERTMLPITVSWALKITPCPPRSVRGSRTSRSSQALCARPLDRSLALRPLIGDERGAGMKAAPFHPERLQ